MRKSQAHRRGRLGMLAALAVAIGALVPISTEAPSAQAAYAAMIQPTSGYIVSRVADGCGGSRPTHAGIDISHNGGSTIVAAYGGTVTTRVVNYGTTGYGNYVIITHPGGYTTLYGHMKDSPEVAQGQTVAKGQRLGIVGSTGNSSGAHLHFELKRNGANIANQGYTCNTNVTRGNPIPMDFPGLSGGDGGFDLNSDGNADILGVGATGTLTAYLNDGNAGLTGQTVGTGWGTTTSLVRGDFNSDGRGDLVTVQSDGTQWFYRGNGNLSFSSSQVGHGWTNMSLISGGADFNSDGREDIIARDAAGDLYAYRGNGAGSFPDPIRIGVNWTGINALVAGDFNGDAKGDVIARTTGGTLLLYPGTPSGLGAGVQVGTGWSGMTALAGGGDYNSDGRADLIARNSGGSLLLYTGTSSGFSGPIEIGHGWNGQRLIG